MIFSDFPKNLRITYGKYFIGFWKQLVEVLEVFLWNFEKIGRKFWKNVREIEKKILNNSTNIVESLLRGTEVIWNWCWYYEEILEFSEIISVKLEKNYEELLKKTNFSI